MTGGTADLVLLRHGESTANAAGLFTGMLDVPLTARGAGEAVSAAHLLAAADMDIGMILSSTMLRARQTAAIVLRKLPSPAPMATDWRLNERNYGALTGRSKREVLLEHGEERFLRWRRSLDEPPPPMTEQQRRTIAAEATPEGQPPPGLGRTEDLAAVVTRVRDCLEQRVQPTLRAGVSTLVVAHGNSLRAMVAILEDLSPASIEALNLPTGQPLVYRFPTGHDRPRLPGRYLDPVTAATAAAAIAREGGT